MIAVLLASLALLAFSSACSTALAGARILNTRRSFSIGEKTFLDLDARLSEYRSALTLAHLAGLVGVISMSTLLAAELSDMRWWAMVIAIIGSAVLVILVETPPRTLVSKQPERVMQWTALPLAIMSFLARPITNLIPLSSDALFTHVPLEQQNGGEEEDESEDTGPLEKAREFRQLLEEVNEAPDPQEDEKEMIAAVLTLKETTVKEIMLPRPDFTAVSATSQLAEVVRIIGETGRSRVPLYGGNPDSIVGVLHVQDVLRAVQSPNPPKDLTQIARAPHFVPESKNVRGLLDEFRSSGDHFALVVDEHGGVEGLVTMSDVLSEIVGEMDGPQRPQSDPIQVQAATAIVDGAVLVEDLNDVLDTELQNEGFDTVAGFVLHHLGHIPKPGETLRQDGVEMEVLTTIGRRVRKVRITKLAPEESKGEKDDAETQAR